MTNNNKIFDNNYKDYFFLSNIFMLKAHDTKSIRCIREQEKHVNFQINFDLLSRLCCSGATSCKLKRNSSTYGYS